MVETFIRDDRLPMHVSHVQLFDFARGNKHIRKILIFGHVVIFYIEITLKKHFSNIKSYMDRVKHLECGQAIGSLQADNSPKCVCRYFCINKILLLMKKNTTTINLNLIHKIRF